MSDDLRLDVAGGELHVRIEGAGDGPPLVFLHEGLGSLDLWKGFPGALRRELGDPVTVTYSRHGHGRSDRIHSTRAPGYMHAEADVVLPALIERLGLRRPVLIGHSDGGSIALLYAGAGHGVTALALLAPHVIVEDISVESIGALRRSYANGLQGRLRRHHDHADELFELWSGVWVAPEFRSWDITGRLPAITCPVLVVQGDGDQYGTGAQLDAIRDGVHGACRCVLLPGVGHAPHLEAPPACLAEVAGFVRDVVSGTGNEPRSPSGEG